MEVHVRLVERPTVHIACKIISKEVLPHDVQVGLIILSELPCFQLSGVTSPNMMVLVPQLVREFHYRIAWHPHHLAYSAHINFDAPSLSFPFGAKTT
jgi:hypothetical protein